MKRGLLTIATVALALAAIAAVTIAGQAGAGPVAIEQAAAEGLMPTGCVALTPEAAKSNADRRCRDYQFQVRCQFSSYSSSEKEAWKGWCEENRGLQEGSNPKVPQCGLELTKEATEVGMRCRDYLAKTRCLGGRSSVAGMQDFCARVAPLAGPDPRPRPCTTALAHEPSEEGNLCWAQLVKKHCESGWTGSSGAQDIDELCAEAKKGVKPPVVNPRCDMQMAGEKTPAGLACRAQLYVRECERRSQGTPEQEAFCQQVLREREDETRPTPTRGAETSPKPQIPDPNAPQPGQDGSTPSAGSPNVLLQLGREPACDNQEELSREVRRACEVTGSVMHTYPFSSYGIDNNVSVDVLSKDFWSGEAPIMSLFQWLIVAVWQGLIWLVKVALLLVQWAFGVDPLERSLDHISGSAMAFFNLLGPEWRLTALAVLGVWGFWNGLVRMRFAQTLAGLAASVLLMVGAMWIVYDPRGTVGEVASAANDGALTVLSATSTGELLKPGEGMAKDQRTVFDQMVVGPWCALQFGGLDACNQKTGDGTLTRAELWLSLPANSSARGILYKATKEGPEAIKGETDENKLGDFFDSIGDKLCVFSLGLSGTCKSVKDVFQSQTQEDRDNNPDKVRQFNEAKAKAAQMIQKDPAAVSLQGSEGVFTRAGLLAVIAIGILGAVAFLITIGIRLLMAGVIVLLLILLAPVMLVVAAFGEAGRRRFVAWLQMLLGSALAKLIYAVILGLVLLVVGILHGLLADGPDGKATAGSADWLGSWLLVSTFFWVVTLQLNRILALISPDPASEHGFGLGAGAALYAGNRLVGGSLRSAWQGAMVLPRNAPRIARLARRQRDLGRGATETAIRGRAGDEMRNGALAASSLEGDDLDKRAAGILGGDRSAAARDRIAHLDRKLRRRQLDPDRRTKLEAQRRKAQAALRLQEAKEGWARSWQQRRSGGHHEPSEAALRDRVARRQRDVARWCEDPGSWSSESNRRWAGISDEQWQQAFRDNKMGNSKPMEALRQRSEATLARHRDLIERADSSTPMSPRTAREARAEWGGGSLFDRLSRNPNLGHDPDYARKLRDARRGQREKRRRGY